MAIFNLKYLSESYKSKYNIDDDDDEEEKTPSEVSHLTKDEINKVLSIVHATLPSYPKLKKCCDFIDLTSKDEIDDDGKYASQYDIYYSKSGKSFLKLIEGIVFSGYPNFRSGGNEDFEDDSSSFVKKVNEAISKSGLKAKFSSDNEDEAVGFGVRSMKSK